MTEHKNATVETLTRTGATRSATIRVPEPPPDGAPVALDDIDRDTWDDLRAALVGGLEVDVTVDGEGNVVALTLMTS